MVYELRQYTLHPGQREVLIDVFDREFVESQEDLGIAVVGQFRDLDRPNRFVWVRGFADMPARTAGLTAFYGGPVWAAHKDVANPTMVDFDDVLLLREARPGSGFPPVSRTDHLPAGTLITATIFRLTEPDSPALLDLFEAAVEPLLTEAGSERLALLRTEPAPNTYDALPVREGEHVLVRFARYPDAAAHAAAAPERERVAELLSAHLLAAPDELRLAPTARSLVR